MGPTQWLALRVPAEAIGKSAGEYTGLAEALLEEAVSHSDSEPAQRAWALGELYGLEMQFISRQLSSGSGSEGSFGYSEVSARLARATADRDAARAEFTRLTTPTPQPSKATRGSGSVGITFEP